MGGVSFLFHVRLLHTHSFHFSSLLGTSTHTNPTHPHPCVPLPLRTPTGSFSHGMVTRGIQPTARPTGDDSRPAISIPSTPPSSLSRLALPRLALPRLALPYLTSPPAVLNACVVITTNALLLFAVSTGTDILRRSTSLPRVFRLLWLSSCASFSLLCSGSCKDQQNLVCSCSVVWPSPHLLRISQVLVGAANNSDRADLFRADTLD